MPSPRMLCLDCGYTLDHLDQHRCPECGREFDPANLGSWRAPDEPAKVTPAVSMLWSTGLIALCVYAPALLFLGWTDLASYATSVQARPVLRWLNLKEGPAIAVGSLITLVAVLFAGWVGRAHPSYFYLLAFLGAGWSAFMSISEIAAVLF